MGTCQKWSATKPAVEYFALDWTGLDWTAGAASATLLHTLAVTKDNTAAEAYQIPESAPLLEPRGILGSPFPIDLISAPGESKPPRWFIGFLLCTFVAIEGTPRARVRRLRMAP